MRIGSSVRAFSIETTNTASLATYAMMDDDSFAWIYIIFSFCERNNQRFFSLTQNWKRELCDRFSFFQEIVTAFPYYEIRDQESKDVPSRFEQSMRCLTNNPKQVLNVTIVQ